MLLRWLRDLCRSPRIENVRFPVAGSIGISDPVANRFLADAIGIAPATAAVQALSRHRVGRGLQAPYFDHYYGRTREHYDEQDEKAAKTIL